MGLSFWPYFWFVSTFPARIFWIWLWNLYTKQTKLFFFFYCVKIENNATFLWTFMLTSVFMSDPPDATISSSTDHWHVGLEKAELTCKGGGLPIPHNITWIRYSTTFFLLIMQYKLTANMVWLWHFQVHPDYSLCLTKSLWVWHWKVTWALSSHRQPVLPSKLDGSLFKSCKRKAELLLNVKLGNLGRVQFSSEDVCEQHEEEQETRTKHLIIVSCFKYHNVW